MTNNYPKLHNAAWPGLVGKGPDSEPPIDLDTMINFTAAANVGGVKFDGMDLFLFDPHISIDIDDDRLKKLAEKFQAIVIDVDADVRIEERSEEHTSELQSHVNLVCRLLLDKKNK